MIASHITLTDLPAWKEIQPNRPAPIDRRPGKTSKTSPAVLMKALKENPTLHSWRELAETTMTRLIIFNKRCGGEASKMLLTNFQARPDWKQCSSTAIESSLQPIERELCKRYLIIYPILNH